MVTSTAAGTLLREILVGNSFRHISRKVWAICFCVSGCKGIMIIWVRGKVLIRVFIAVIVWIRVFFLWILVIVIKLILNHSSIMILRWGIVEFVIMIIWRVLNESEWLVAWVVIFLEVVITLLANGHLVISLWILLLLRHYFPFISLLFLSETLLFRWFVAVSMLI